MSLAGSLKGIICQRLIPTADGKGRVPALELLVVNGRIQQAILDPLLTADIDGIIADGEYYGMLTFDQSLVNLHRRRHHRPGRGHEHRHQPPRPQGHAGAPGHPRHRPVRRRQPVLSSPADRGGLRPLNWPFAVGRTA